MNSDDRHRIEEFIQRWDGSQGNERANYQAFFSELCDAIAVDRPFPKGDPSGDRYCFEKDIKIVHPSGKYTSGFIDFYKEGHFVIEAKQGGTKTGKGTAKRGTNAYRKAMRDAFYQAIPYARSLPVKPPFILTCDIGSHFELWRGFSESWQGATGDYGNYERKQEIPLGDLRKEDVFQLFVDIFTDPQCQNPEKIAAKVTREVAADLAVLSKSMEEQFDAEEVAHFLMRCIFTMFAEDVGLLKEHLFTEALETRWLQNPQQFKPQVEALWQAMNEGTSFGFHGQLLRFNGGLFADSTAFDLNAEQLQTLLAAAKKDWRNVEPAIFGTLLERALDKTERSKLGAHYTPRSYVERLVIPVVLEPLQEQWKLVQGEVEKLLGDRAKEPTTAKKNKARSLLDEFLQTLREVKVLDPACGSGNFLYVTLDSMKQLESEVLRLLGEITGQEQLKLDFDQVNPSQFLGIEINPRAAAIADLVIWIGYLQWHFRRFGDLPPVEPVLREYHNIEHRDAVLEYDRQEPDIDPKTREVRTRWGGKTKRHPVTGENVPDPDDKVTIYKYFNPRSPQWPQADYIISNPPFVGNARMRELLGDGYAETLRSVYKDVPETVDFVMYWWHKAAELVRSSAVDRFGLITTNSIRQARQRTVIEFHQRQKNAIEIFFAIPDHPWVDGGAAVRIAMTAVKSKNAKVASMGQIGSVVEEEHRETPEDTAENVVVEVQQTGEIFSNLDSGFDITSAQPLKSNSGIAGRGVMLGSSGFRVELNSTDAVEATLLKKYLNGRDLLHQSRNYLAIDTFGLTDKILELQYPKAYQWLLEKVKPERDVNKRKVRRENWWLFGETMPKTRASIRDLDRYIATVETAKHRVFLFLDRDILPDNKLIVIALEDAYFLGILSSRIHVTWSLVSGARLEDRPVYPKSTCFDPFPFPDASETQKRSIRELGERLDAHRKRVQKQHPDVTITGMYNLLEKLKTGEPLTEKEREFNHKALVSTLKQIHDDLDRAVFFAYGWDDLLDIDNHQQLEETILDRLVKLNRDRATEERNGCVRWLRPDYQAPEESATQTVIEGVDIAEVDAIAPPEQMKWPKPFKDRLAAVRDLLRTRGDEWTIAQITAQFKKAKPADIGECLDILQGLGLVLCHDEGDERRWYAAELQQAS